MFSLKHRLIAVFIVALQLNLFPQVYGCKNGIIRFTSEAPLELIKAQSNKAAGALDVNTKNVAFSIDIDSFEGFNSGLQKEHFRENYMETDKYPRATFKGKIIEEVDFSKQGVSVVRAKGTFNIHGTEKERIVKVKLHVNGGDIHVESNFEIPLEDHNIRIPKVVNQKIASVILVELNAVLKPKK